MTQSKTTLRELPTLILLFLLCALMAWFVPAFRSASNLTIVGEEAAFIGVMACGEGLVILSGGLDLSIGAIVAVSTCVTAFSLSAGLPWPLAALCGMGAGALAGGLNGALVTYRRLPPILTTLATLLLFRHGTSLLTHARSFGPFPDTFRLLGTGWTPALLFLAVVLISVALSKQTRFGRWTLAIGGGEQSARLSGIPVTAVKRGTYVLSGLCAGLAGLITMAFNNTTQSTVGEGAELNVIAACVVGGIRITGGDGSLLGAALGALLIAFLRNALILTHRPQQQSNLFVAGVILAAAVLENWRQGRIGPRPTKTGAHPVETSKPATSLPETTGSETAGTEE